MTAVVAFIVGRPWILLLAGVLAWGSVGNVRAWNARRLLQDERSAHAAEQAAAQAAWNKEKGRILTDQQEAINASNQARAADRVARDRAAAAAAAAERMLHDAVAARVAGAATAGDCPATAAALGTVLDESATRHRKLGEDADAALAESRAAGSECERLYDTLRPK